jgi:hypothetical protein
MSLSLTRQSLIADSSNSIFTTADPAGKARVGEIPDSFLMCLAGYRCAHDRDYDNAKAEIPGLRVCGRPGYCQLGQTRVRLARPGMTAVQLDENRARPYSGAHDDDRGHFDRPPPPYPCGMGGDLRLRYQPLPPDPVRGTSFCSSAI